MGQIWISSDFHFNHNREFIYEARGFDSVEEMNAAIIQNWNQRVRADEVGYILGDLMLGGASAQAYESGLNLIKHLNGELHIILGNHDTLAREQLYRTLPNVVEVTLAARLNYDGYHFYLSHFPTMTSNFEKESLRQCTIGLYGHTHQTTNFFDDIPYMYHCGVDSHQCAPVSIEEIIGECEAKVKECKAQL